MALWNCEDSLEQISRGLDGDLTPQEQTALEEHLAACPQCRALARELTELHQLMGELEETPAPDTLAPSVMAAIRREKKPVPLGLRPWFRTVGGLAACAVICLGLYAFNPGLLSGSSEVPGQQSGTSQSQPAPANRGQENVQQEETPQQEELPQSDSVPQQEELPQSDSVPQQEQQTRDLPQQEPAQEQPQQEPAQEQPQQEPKQDSPAVQSGQAQQEVPSQERSPQSDAYTAAANTQTVFVLDALPESVGALLPALDEWQVEENGQVSCLVDASVLEQIIKALEDAGEQVEVPARPWSSQCRVVLGG